MGVELAAQQGVGADRRMSGSFFNTCVARELRPVRIADRRLPPRRGARSLGGARFGEARPRMATRPRHRALRDCPRRSPAALWCIDALTEAPVSVASGLVWGADAPRQYPLPARTRPFVFRTTTPFSLARRLPPVESSAPDGPGFEAHQSTMVQLAIVDRVEPAHAVPIVRHSPRNVRSARANSLPDPNGVSQPAVPIRQSVSPRSPPG